MCDRMGGKSTLFWLVTILYAMFKDSNALVTGGIFNYVGYMDRRVASGKDGFEHLQERVAKTAFHNSAQRLNPPRCHPNTRTTVTSDIMAWIRGEPARKSWILWLTAAAGAGKSAILQSVAELCENEGIPLATFFFFRTDPSRNKVDPLVATLAYQVAVRFPEVCQLVARTIERDPLIFERSLRFQISTLILDPLRNLGYLSSDSILCQYPYLFVIDGLDECANRDIQVDIIHALADTLKDGNLPIIFLVAARGEPHLKMAINQWTARGMAQSLVVDDKYHPEVDIRLFINDKLREIKDYHPFKALIEQHWPPAHQVDNIVAKSSGQFIYASVVMHFLSAGGRNPVHSLEIVEGAHPVLTNNNPFFNLDVLYQQIFSNVVDLEATLCTLAYSILTPDPTSHPMYQYLNWTPLAVQIALADLLSVVDLRDDAVTFLHGSLPDYLLDKNRSQLYHLDTKKWSTHFALHWLKRDTLGNDHQTGLAQLTLYLRKAIPTIDLHEEILRFEPGLLTISDPFAEVEVVAEFLSAINQLDFNDGKKAYQNQVNKFTKSIKASSDPAWRLLSKSLPVKKARTGPLGKWTSILSDTTHIFGRSRNLT